MILSKLADFIKRFDVLLISVAILVIILCTINASIVDPSFAVGSGLMIYFCIWSIFAFVRWYNGKRWNY